MAQTPGLATNVKRIDVLEAYRLRTTAKLTYEQIGQLQGITKQAVQTGLKRFAESLPDSDQLQSFENARASLINAGAQTLLASCFDPDVMAKAGLRDRVVSFGIMYDKYRLETAQSTSNISVLSKMIGQADSGLFSKQAEPQAAPCLENSEANSETSTSDINKL